MTATRRRTSVRRGMRAVLALAVAVSVSTWPAATPPAAGAATAAATAGSRATGEADATVTPVVAPRWLQQIGRSGRAAVYPSGVDVARPSRGANAVQSGWVFVADTGNDRVAAYRADGRLLWRAGLRGRGDGRFSEPRDVAYLKGRVYVADTGNNRVQILNAATGAHLATWPTRFGAAMGVTAGRDRFGVWRVVVADGKLSRVSVHDMADTTRLYVGASGRGEGQLNEPRDAALDRSGNLYVADFGNHRISVYDPLYRWSRAFGSLGGEPGQFRGPYGVEIDDADGVYVADSNNQRVQKLTTAGRHVRSWGRRGTEPGRLRQLRNVAVGAGRDPDVFAVDLWGYKVEQWDARGRHLRTFAGKPPRDGRFNKPHGVALNRRQLYVADSVHHRVQRFDREGRFRSSFGDRGWAGQLGGLNWPRGVAVDRARKVVWVADTKNWRVTEFTLDGEPTGVGYGRRGPGPDTLSWPSAVAPVGNGVVIADTYNHRVVRWDPDVGRMWIATGFNFPKDVTVDQRSSTVYVADSLNKRIVKLGLSDGARRGNLGTGLLRRVEGVALDSDGDVWVANTGGNRIVELSPEGAVKQRYGSRGSDHGQFWEPTGIAIRRTATGDRLYVADTFNDRVEVFAIR